MAAATRKRKKPGEVLTEAEKKQRIKDAKQKVRPC